MSNAVYEFENQHNIINFHSFFKQRNVYKIAINKVYTSEQDLFSLFYKKIFRVVCKKIQGRYDKKYVLEISLISL